MDVTISLQPLATIAGQVFLPDGITPATNATVTLGRWSSDTDINGRVSFVDLPLSSHQVTAQALATDQSHSFASTSVSLTSAGPAPDFRLVLSGVGSVSGRVFESDGVTPAAGIEIRIEFQGAPFAGASQNSATSPSGTFQFGNVALGPYRLVSEQAALAATFNGIILTNGQADMAQLTLSANGAVVGRVVRADQTTPVSGSKSSCCSSLKRRPRAARWR